MVRKSKLDLFSLWLDSGYDWDAVECEVQRTAGSKQVARRDMQAIQAKVLQKEMTEDRFKELIAKRVASGLYYEDDDHPEDPMDRDIAKMSSKLGTRWFSI